VIDDPDVQVYLGDALEVLRTLPSESVQVVASSPPFWGLRDYGVAGQIGDEETPEAWAQRLVDVYREARRLLRADGVMFVEVGDSWNANTGPGYNANHHRPREYTRRVEADLGTTRRRLAHVKVKDLVGLPWLLAFALRADGWYLRSEIIWARPNPMPESAKDRPTKAHSTVFLLSKRARYFWDWKAIREPADPSPTGGRQRAVLAGDDKYRSSPNDWKDAGRGDGRAKRLNGGGADPTTRNSRSVWTMPTEPTPYKHFATWPQALVRRMILAGSREGDTILDPFMGSGTTALVARQLGRRAIGVEINAEYLEIARRRLRQLSLLG
jgi:DNA modification methylase